MFFLEMLSKMASKKFLEGPSMLLTKCLESTNEKSPFLFSAAFLLSIINNLINSFLFLSYIIIVSYLFGFFPMLFLLKNCYVYKIQIIVIKYRLCVCIPAICIMKSQG